jgi:hypothetical protein
MIVKRNNLVHLLAERTRPVTQILRKCANRRLCTIFGSQPDPNLAQLANQERSNPADQNGRRRGDLVTLKRKTSPPAGQPGYATALAGAAFPKALTELRTAASVKGLVVSRISNAAGTISL